MQKEDAGGPAPALQLPGAGAPVGQGEKSKMPGSLPRRYKKN